MPTWSGSRSSGWTGRTGRTDALAHSAIQSEPAVTLAGVTPGREPIKLVMPEANVPSGYVVGRVLDADGAELAELYVSAMRLAARSRTRHSSASGRWSFRFGPLAPGTHELSGHSNGENSCLGIVTVTADATSDLGTTTLEHAGSLQVGVVQSTGEPLLAGMLVVLRDDDAQGRSLTYLEGGEATFESLQPGSDRLHVGSKGCSTYFPSTPIIVEPRKRTHAALNLPHMVRRTIRMASPSTVDTRVEVTWTWIGLGPDDESSIVDRGLVELPSSGEPAQWCTHVAPGRYRVTTTLPGGSASREVTVEDVEAPDEVIELPLPEGW